jgi:alpha-glucosidase
VLVFVREHPDETVLIVAARADFEVPLALPAEVELLWGTAVAAGDTLTGSGPSFTAFRLPGVALPPF